MKREVIKDSGKIIHHLHFDNMLEIIEFINNFSACSIWDRLYSITGDYVYSGTKSFEEAIDLSLYGDPQNFVNFMQINKKLNDTMPFLTQKRDVIHSPYGFRPNIPRALTKNPDSMYKLERRDEKKFVSLYYNTAISSMKIIPGETEEMKKARSVTEKNAIINRGVITMSFIKLLEQVDYRVKLNLLSLSRLIIEGGKKDDRGNIVKPEVLGNEYIYITLNVKEEAQKLDSNICFFPMCHPSFPRRIVLALKERCNVESPNWTTNQRPLNKPEVIDFLNLGDKVIVIGTPQELNLKGKDIIEDTQAYLKATNFNSYISNNGALEYEASTNKFVLRR